MTREIIFTAKEYKEKYNGLMQSYLLEYEDYEEIDFINEEIEMYKMYNNDITFYKEFWHIEQTNGYLCSLGTDAPDIRITNKVVTFERKNAEFIIYEKPNSFSIDKPLCLKIGISFNKIIGFLELKKVNPNQKKHINNKESNFFDFIHNVTNKELFASELKDIFNIETGIDFKIMIELLKAEGIFSFTQFAPFCRNIKTYFVRDIGTQNGLNDLYKHSKYEQKHYADKITTIQNKLNMLITKHKIK